ncbi:ABC transporter ATP-binding protein [Gynuella sunshinyii]|uniref:ABC-type multidrug transport system, ATPase and permease component n=1 Tax=Gynuella sunshinyii YC6258 TaxID=1445510 RepID=A0A0C5V363_9GAMM|nr:ABC transporter ATP-binding protein [Gynuella sunshinyii]AJQ93975.1 ABC-type multidrug transport system, ATPase and permease component [Gynuella sunshinyii YC6258]
MLRFFEKLTNPFPAPEPDQPPSKLLAFCLHYSKGMWGSLIAMSILTSLIAIFEVSLFGFLGKLVDWLAVKNPATLLTDEWPTLITMASVTLIGLPLLVLLHGLVVHQALLGNFPMSIRWQAHRYLLKQSLSFYQNDFAGRVATKVMQTSLSLRETVMKLLDVLVFVSVYFVTMVILIAQADIRLVAPVVIWLLGYIVSQLYFVPRLKQVSAEQANARALMTGRIVDSYTNIATVKLFSHTARESDYAHEGMTEFLGSVYRQMRLVTGFNVSVQVLSYVLTFAVAALSVWLWVNGNISAGAIAIAISLTLRLNGMAQWIMWEVSALFENIGTVADGMDTLSKPQQINDVEGASQLTVDQGNIQYQNIGFHYGKGSGIIEALTLNIKPGEKVGLVGRSGAGKSTLVNLLLRFYDLESGQILIDGQDISQVTQESLRSKIGMVTQDTSLLHRSVRDNILYGRPDATEEEMIAAAKQAEAHEFILGLSDPEGRTGYDAQVGERGVKLSGGQRQRIAIARVLLKNAPILVLDEATSALDSEIESAIQHSLYRLMEGKTVIAIAHRLSTIAAMDRLIVLDQGQVVEQGTHQQLARSGGIYAQLWAHQTGGYLGIETEEETA